MNENAKRWVEALRSGEFEQGRGRLKENDRYCCLGVACVLYNEEQRARKKRQVHFENGALYEQEEPVRVWLGLAHGDGAFDEGRTALTVRNDNGATFDQIAAIIESEPEGLFE